jgi:serine/threonine protein kinase
MVNDHDELHLPGWSVLGSLGYGHGKTFRALRESDGLHAVLEFIILDDDNSARFLGTLDQVKDIKHPNLLGVLQVERMSGGVVIATPGQGDGLSFIELQRLYRTINRTVLIDYVKAAASGLDFLAERAGCPHGNVNLDNLITFGRSVRLTRYGYPDKLALAADTSGAHSIGTQFYLPPERYRSREVTAHGDQFALAMVYCHLRLGYCPAFPHQWEKLSGLRPFDLDGLPASERAVVARALVADPTGRWSNCETFADALAQATEPADSGT